ncbi:MAG: hypothetical protein LC632_00965 [Xanthomonadaceae bacterium]|nr:hypothetical protein [Xanthomonadaceae bacterium]
MSVADVATITIALIALAVSLYAVTRDRRQRQFDLFLRCHDRLKQLQKETPLLPPSQYLEMEEDPGNPAWEKYQIQSTEAQLRLDSELETACYLAVKGELNVEVFFNLFRGWLAMRDVMWTSGVGEHRARNHPYTVAVIEMCRRRKLLPIKDNVEFREMTKLVNEYLGESASSNKALERSR